MSDKVYQIIVAVQKVLEQQPDESTRSPAKNILNALEH